MTTPKTVRQTIFHLPAELQEVVDQLAEEYGSKQAAWRAIVRESRLLDGRRIRWPEIEHGGKRRGSGRKRDK